MERIRKYLNGDTVFGLMIIAVSTAFFIGGLKLANVKIGNTMDAGFFPRMLALVVGIMGVMLVITGIRDPKDYFGGAEKRDVKQFFETVALVALYVILWPYIHFIPLSIAFLVGMGWVLKLSWKFIIPYSVIMSCGLYYVFANIFKIILN